MMLRSNSQPVYSVDACSIIGLCQHYPLDVFPCMWDVVNQLCLDGRFLVCEEAANECIDEASAQFIREHRLVVVPFGDIQAHLSRVQVDAHENQMHLVDPDATEEDADPFVLALGLCLDGRDPDRLHEKVSSSLHGVVVTEEKPKGPGWKRPKLPNVCDFYALDWVPWVEFLRREEYSG